MKYFLHSIYNISYVSGPCYDDLDSKNGKMTPWSLCFHGQIAVAGVHINSDDKSIYPALYYPIEDPAETEQSVTGFVRLFQLEILPAFHRQHHFALTMQMEKWFSYLGNTSYCQDFAYKNALTGELLATAINHNVHVDFKSRRPVKIPEQWVREVRKEKLTRSKPPQGFKQPPQPDKCHVFTTMVMSSCVDSNQHQNMAFHLRNCWDAGSDAACNGKLSKFNTNLSYYDLKQVTFLYQGEVVIGDTLHVACWEHSDNPHNLCFTMTKMSKVIDQCQMEFYPVSHKHEKAKL